MSQHTNPPVEVDTHVDQLISLDAQQIGGWQLVTVIGEVDMVTSPHLRSYLWHQVERGGAPLVLDLRGVTFLGSSGLAVLVETLDWTRDRGIALRLVCNSREVIRPLEATGLTDLFDIHADPDEVLASPC